MNSLTTKKQDSLNGICPYFTMFPLGFPLNILRVNANKDDYVLDPFCGRGTTNFAARLLGLDSLGVDSSKVAQAITAAKLTNVTVEEIISEANQIICGRQAQIIPESEFWHWAYDPDVLNILCQFREAFLEDCSTPARIALRGIVLGSLHGPKQKTFQSYFSNQSPRTYAPKPNYSVNYWRDRGLIPEPVDVMSIIERRAKRYYDHSLETTGNVRLGDSRKSDVLIPDEPNKQFSWVITSPPYYKMSTYIPDQWLRNWFVGGSDSVDYSNLEQITHSSPDIFCDDLKKVWRNAFGVCEENANMVIRFGGINNKNRTKPLELIKQSLQNSGWQITKVIGAGFANEGKRQADAFLKTKTNPISEYDIWATRN